MLQTKQTPPDIVPAYPFVRHVQGDLICDNAFVLFNSITGQVTTGLPNFFQSNPSLERKRILAVSLCVINFPVSVNADDTEAIQVGGIWYNIPSTFNITDYYLRLFNKSGDIIWNAFPLSRLPYLQNLTDPKQRLLATDIKDISLTDSFVFKSGSSTASISLPWCFMFQFYYKSSEN